MRFEPRTHVRQRGGEKADCDVLVSHDLNCGVDGPCVFRVATLDVQQPCDGRLEVGLGRGGGGRRGRERGVGGAGRGLLCYTTDILWWYCTSTRLLRLTCAAKYEGLEDKKRNKETKRGKKKPGMLRDREAENIETWNGARTALLLVRIFKYTAIFLLSLLAPEARY